MNSIPLNPTYVGFIQSTHDALILFECCLSGKLKHAPRRPHDRERESIIKSGNIFIYEEHSSGIKRWTDGISWSPSRILGNFLIYRQLIRNFPAGEKKKALKKKASPNGIQKNSCDSRKNSLASSSDMGPIVGTTPYTQNGIITPEQERSLIGSLTDSYEFMDGGLVKKTISVTFQEVTHHLVSYYNLDDAIHGNLRSPKHDPQFNDVRIRPELLKDQSFRSPIDETDPADHAPYRPRPQYALTGAGLGGLGGPSMSAPMPMLGIQPSGYMMGSYGMALPGAAVSSAAYGNGSSMYSTAHAYGNGYPNSTSGIYQSQQRGGLFGGDMSRQRFDSGSLTTGLDNRAPMPSPAYDSRGRKYSSHGSADSGISGISLSDSAYHSSHQEQRNGGGGAYYSGQRESSQTNGSSAYYDPKPSMQLPEFSRPQYNTDRTGAQDLRSGLGDRDALSSWSLPNGSSGAGMQTGMQDGNAGAGHAHPGSYQPQQWTQ